jgi:hypothetical protein
LSAQPQGSSTSPQVAWSDVRQLLQNLETAVQSKNLYGIHEPSMKIRAPIRTLKQHSSTLGGDASKNMVAALKQLDSAVTDVHSAADAGDQKEAKSALKAVQTSARRLQDKEVWAASRRACLACEVPTVKGSTTSIAGASHCVFWLQRASTPANQPQVWHLNRRDARAQDMSNTLTLE